MTILGTNSQNNLHKNGGVFLKKLLKPLCLFMALLFALQINASALILEYDGSKHEYSGNLYKLYVRNKPVYSDMEPIIFNDRALVPVREICEAIGAEVTYTQSTQTIEIVKDSMYVRLKINDNVAIVNGKKVSIPDNVVPKLINKVGYNTKTMVPVRFISEMIGLDVEFNEEKGAIFIDSSGSDIATPKPVATPTPVPTQKPQPTKTPLPTSTNTPKPTASQTPAPERSTITDLSYTMPESNKIAVTVSLDKKTKYSYFTLTDPERLVVDFPYTDIKLYQNIFNVNKGGINSVRVGINPDRARIVIDTDKLKSYGFETRNNDVIIYAKAEDLPNTTPKPSATQKPSTTQKPSSTATPSITPKPTREPIIHTATEKYVVIDAGHGGNDPGALGELDGKTIRESDLTLSISNKVKKLVEEAGYKVYMTRSTDVYKTLVERPAYANKIDAAVFVSIHINSAENNEAYGSEVYYAESNNENLYGTTSSVLAKNVLNRMLLNTGATNRGVRTAEHAVTKRSNMPSCLVEVGFISNTDELAKMVDNTYQNKVAKGIADGILLTLKDITVFD